MQSTETLEAVEVQEPGLSSYRFEELGIDAKDAADWSDVGFGPFEAALAHGDGFTPSIIEHYRHQLERIARSWAEVGLDCAEGLQWHRAGFAAKEAASWRAQGVDVETARARRAGYVHAPRGAASVDRPTHRTS
ncbi:MAG TPA: hypothetical protein VE991_12685 [Acidimicrobiales bacterium]|nr:hypothetical protein [Acidimicrobiales bacterium]